MSEKPLQLGRVCQWVCIREDGAMGHSLNRHNTDAFNHDQVILKTFVLKKTLMPRPDSGLDWLMCAIFT